MRARSRDCGGHDSCVRQAGTSDALQHARARTLPQRTHAPCCGVRYEPNGMSPTSSGRQAPRATAAQWRNMSIIVTWAVESYPSTTMPRESPTRMQSTEPTASIAFAIG